MRLDKVVQNTLSSVMTIVMRADAANEGQGLQAVCRKLEEVERKQEGVGKSIIKLVRTILEPPQSGGASVLDEKGEYTKMLQQLSAESQMAIVGRAASSVGLGVHINQHELDDFKQLQKVQQQIQANFAKRSDFSSDIASSDMLYDQFGTLLTKVLVAAGGSALVVGLVPVLCAMVYTGAKTGYGEYLQYQKQQLGDQQSQLNSSMLAIAKKNLTPALVHIHGILLEQGIKISPAAFSKRLKDGIAAIDKAEDFRKAMDCYYDCVFDLQRVAHDPQSQVVVSPQVAQQSQFAHQTHIRLKEVELKQKIKKLKDLTVDEEEFRALTKKLGLSDPAQIELQSKLVTIQNKKTGLEAELVVKRGLVSGLTAQLKDSSAILDEISKLESQLKSLQIEMQAVKQYFFESGKENSKIESYQWKNILEYSENIARNAPEVDRLRQEIARDTRWLEQEKLALQRSGSPLSPRQQQTAGMMGRLGNIQMLSPKTDSATPTIAVGSFGFVSPTTTSPINEFNQAESDHSTVDEGKEGPDEKSKSSAAVEARYQRAARLNRAMTPLLTGQPKDLKAQAMEQIFKIDKSTKSFSIDFGKLGVLIQDTMKSGGDIKALETECIKKWGEWSAACGQMLGSFMGVAAGGAELSKSITPLQEFLARFNSAVERVKQISPQQLSSPTGLADAKQASSNHASLFNSRAAVSSPPSSAQNAFRAALRQALPAGRASNPELLEKAVKQALNSAVAPEQLLSLYKSHLMSRGGGFKDSDEILFTQLVQRVQKEIAAEPSSPSI